MSNTITNKNDLFTLFEEVFQDWAENGKALTEMSDKARKKEAEKFLLSLPKFTPTEAWGNPESTGRKTSLIPHESTSVKSVGTVEACPELQLCERIPNWP